MAERGFARKAAFFLLKFFIIYSVLQAAILISPIGPLKEGIALFEAGLLGLESEGNIITLNGSRAEIVANCTGLMSISVLAAIVFSLRKPAIKKKIGLFAVGAALLFPLNLLRIYLVLLAAMAFDLEAFEAIHTTTWFGTSAAILILWYYLTKRVTKAKEFGNMI
jgi:exosortase/archaeosortase family protein